MGFFKNIFKKPKNILKTVVKTVKSPAKLTTVVLTGGASIVAPKLFKPVTSAVQSTLFNPQLALAVASKGAVSPSSFGSGGSPMAINIGGLLSNIGGILGGIQGANAAPIRALGVASSLVGSAIPAKATRPSLPSPSAGANGPKVPMLGASVGTIARSFFNKYPNLATGLQRLRNAYGKKITRAKLYSIMKSYGPAFLVQAGILTAAAVSELAMAGPGRRRMNAANVHALRRSLRRLESFHHLCSKVDKLRRPSHRKSKGKFGSGSTFVRQG